MIQLPRVVWRLLACLKWSPSQIGLSLLLLLVLFFFCCYCCWCWCCWFCQCCWLLVVGCVLCVVCCVLCVVDCVLLVVCCWLSVVRHLFRGLLDFFRCVSPSPPLFPPPRPLVLLAYNPPPPTGEGSRSRDRWLRTPLLLWPPLQARAPLPGQAAQDLASSMAPTHKSSAPLTSGSGTRYFNGPRTQIFSSWDRLLRTSELMWPP